jgi:MFS family permease
MDLHARLAVCWIFWLCGVICSLWSTSLPAINARLHLGETRLGIVLLFVAAGAIAVMPPAGRLCDRIGGRTVLRVGAPLSGLTLIGPALAPSFLSLLGLGFLLGVGIGSLDVAMNAHAIVVEQRYGRPIMASFHGLWSIGAVTGSVVIATGLRLGAGDPSLMIGGAFAVALLLTLPSAWLLPPGQSSAPRPDGAQAAHLDRSVVLLLGLIAMAGFMSEGAALNWAPLDAIRELRVSPATAALAYTIFTASLTTGRFTGDRLRRRLGSVRVIGLAGLVAGCGYLLVLLAPSLHRSGLAWDYAGWGVAGIGLATVVPGVFSAVGAGGAAVGRTLSTVTTCAYGGELAGPAIIGPLAGATSLRIALLVPVALAALIAVVGPIAVHRATAGERAGSPRPQGAPAAQPGPGAGTPIGLG